MSIVWPLGLPQKLQASGYQESAPSTVVRTAMDTGPAKIRRRMTSAPRRIKGSVMLTAEQVAILDEFFLSTLSGGAVAFDWLHPRTGATASFRFVSPPAYQNIGGTTYSAALDLEILP